MFYGLHFTPLSLDVNRTTKLICKWLFWECACSHIYIYIYTSKFTRQINAGDLWGKQMIGARPVTMHNHAPFSKQNIQVHLCQEPPKQLLPHSVRAINNRTHSCCPFQYYRIIMHLRFYRRKRTI